MRIEINCYNSSHKSIKLISLNNYYDKSAKSTIISVQTSTLGLIKKKFKSELGRNRGGGEAKNALDGLRNYSTVPQPLILNDTPTTRCAPAARHGHCPKLAAGQLPVFRRAINFKPHIR